jgi:hypothetical protein
MMFYITFSVSLRLPPFPHGGKGILLSAFALSAFALSAFAPSAFAPSAFRLPL